MNDSVDPPDVTTIDGTSRIGGSAKSDEKSRRTLLKVLLAQHSTVSGPAPSFMVTQRQRGHRGRVRDWVRPFRAKTANHRSPASSERFFLEVTSSSNPGADSICPERARSAGSRTALAPLQFRKMRCQNERKKLARIRYQATCHGIKLESGDLQRFFMIDEIDHVSKKKSHQTVCVREFVRAQWFLRGCLSPKLLWP